MKSIYLRQMKVANNFSSTIASYVKNNCILPAETVYTKLSADWSGSVTHLFKIFKLKDNYILLNDCLVEINEISKVVEKVIHADDFRWNSITIRNSL